MEEAKQTQTQTQTQTNSNFFEAGELNILPMKRLNQTMENEKNEPKESHRDPPPTFPDDPLKPRSPPPAPQKKGIKRPRT